MKAGQLTRRKGALERLINNLETFKKEKKDKVSIKTGKGQVLSKMIVF